MFDSILVALDGSEHSDKALGVAIELARRCEARLVLFHALQQTPLSGNYASMVASAAREAYANIAREQGEAILAKALQTAVEQDVEKVETLLRSGDPAQSMVDAAEELGVGVLVVGTRGLTGLKGVTLGSVARKVTLAAGCPVLVVK